MKSPVRVAVTGAAGQIGYSLLFRIASGEMLGKDQPVILQLLEITPALNALKGVVMELDDCAFPLLAGVVQSDDPEVAFKDADIALLVGARPRSKGMERKDLLEANGAIFTVQGAALNKVASRDVKVLVVGNPANTNAYIAMKSAPDLPSKNFTAMLRLDHNRALSQLPQRPVKVSTRSNNSSFGETIHQPCIQIIVSRPLVAIRRQVPLTIKNGMRTPLSQPWVSEVPPLSRPEGSPQPHQPHQPQSIMFGTGLTERMANGQPWVFRQTGHTAFQRASFTASQQRAPTVSIPLLQDSTLTTSVENKWIKPCKSLRKSALRSTIYLANQEAA
jgi:hypothetical protein